MFAVSLAFLLYSAQALDNGFTRPPLGWSALYGAPFSTVNETIVRAAAQGLKDGGFTSAGYGYVILDDWYATRDANNKIIGLPSTWPSGMASTSDFIHNLGLKFGVYSAASQRTCGNYSASQFLEEQDADTFANDWKIDWLKYDSCYYNNGVASRARYTTMRDALNRTGRQIFYSMEGQAYFPDVGNMWRTGGDIWPKWDECVLRNLYSNNAQASLFQPGAGVFNDPDMIQSLGTEGGTTLTFEEARAQFVLWAVMKAPLILGAHYSLLATMRTDLPEYFQLLTHPELIAINQDISPQATLTQSMPSTLQQGGGSQVQVSLQACDPRREDQKFISPGAGASAPLHAIQSLHGNLCLTSSSSTTPSGASVFASPCSNSSSSEQQSWPGLLPSQLSVAQSGAQEGMCLGANGSQPSTGPCIYTGSLPPPFELSLGDQLWVWDMKGGWGWGWGVPIIARTH
jgi:hypothetical protein